jgi:hypothetical protein
VRVFGEVLCASVLVNSGLEKRDNGRRGSAALTMDIPHPQKLALTSPTSGCRSVGIVRWRTKATELVSKEDKNYRFVTIVYGKFHLEMETENSLRTSCFKFNC